MLIELKKIIKILKELNNSLEQKILNKKDIKDAEKSTKEFLLFKNKIKEISTKLTSYKTLKKKEISYLLIDLHGYFVGCMSILEEVWDLLKKMIGNYGD